ncbi:CehA/McbA family metallohydrolase [Sorangium cellulosum]|nr:CehA/McbA family metallohydrolase [Sorangium cellulosum]
MPRRLLAPSVLALLVAPACAGGRDMAPPAPPPELLELPPEAELPEVELAPPAGAEGRVAEIRGREEVPLTGPRVDAAPGDWMLAHGDRVAVVSARGDVVDFGVVGGRDELGAVRPLMHVALSAPADDVLHIEPVGAGGRVLRVVRAARGYPLRLVSWIYFAGTTLRIESAAVGVPPAEAPDPNLGGEAVNPNLGGEAANPNLAAIPNLGAPAPNPGAAPANPNPGAPAPPAPNPGGTPATPNPGGAPAPAARRWPAVAATLGERAGWGNVPTWVEGHGFATTPGRFTTAFLARESSGVAYALCSLGGPLRATFGPQVLSGFFESAVTGEAVELVPYGGASSRRAIALATAPSAGDAAVQLPCLRAGGVTRLPLPLLAARGAHAETARCDPAGRPGRIFAHFAAAQAPGLGDRREIELPHGCFHVRLGAPGFVPGPWTRADTLAAQPREAILPTAGRLRFRVTEAGRPVPARVLVRGLGGTPDPHWGDDAAGGLALNVAHADRGEGDVPLPPGRYRVSVGRGFEYTVHEQEITVAAGQTAEVRAAIARVVDTAGWIAADLHLHAEPSPDAPTRLAERVRSLVAAGVEVAVATDHNAVTDYGPAIRELGLGAAIAGMVGDEVTTRDPYWGHFNVFPLAPKDPPLAHAGVLPAEIFAEARRRKPYGERTLIQVNHPRMGDIGYFDLLRLDAADVPGWLRRAPIADMSFDALEVFNGDHYDQLHRVEAVMRDWFALLNAGFRVVATGNSDSHRVAFQEPGTPRNLVQVPADAPGRLDERAFVEAVRAGKVVVSSGPFVRLTVAGKGIGESVPEGDAEIEIRVDAPPWVDVDRVELVRRGDVIFRAAVRPPEPATAAAAGAGATRPPRPAGAPRATRVTERTRQTLRKGDWVIAIARGSRPMDHLHRPGALPFAFTNPVFVR